MKLRLLTASLLTSLVALPAMAAPVVYTIDPTHAQVQFTYSHIGYSNITGRFDTIEGTITYDAAQPAASSIEIKVATTSVSTGVEKLDQHLQADDFLDAAKFGDATFKSTKVEAAGTDTLKVSGDLTIHGVTLPATFDVTVNAVSEHPMKKVPAAGFDATGSIDRTKFGIDKYAQATGNDVKLSITVEALAAAAKK